MPDVPPAISTLELTHLKVFRSHNIQARAADYILRRLNAPCCVDFTLILNAGSAANYSPSDMLNSALTSFEPLLCRIGQRMTNRGNLYIDNYRLYWGWEVEEEPIELPSLYVAIELASFLSTIRWVERVVDLTGPEGWRAGSCQVTRVSPLGDEEIQSHFMRLKSIKTINVSHGGENTLRVLNMLRQTGPEPVLLGLRKLELQQEPGYWSESDLLAAIRARFLESGHSYPHLEVSVRNMAPFESYGYHTVNVVMDSRVLDQLRYDQ
ncbi:hypothetical protein FRB90_010200 [Tulasnella sp. 427]|nr:hypothetical protein FRB90_010200 [Tulasnella sp. 427]